MIGHLHHMPTKPSLRFHGLPALWMILSGLMIPICGSGQFTDGMNVAFGKNRVQYRSFEWQYFEQGVFEVYHYREGDQIAGQVSRILELSLIHI